MLREPLILFLLALAVVTVVGHLIWIGIAALFRALLRPLAEEGEIDENRVRCPHCGHPNLRSLDRCDSCRRWLSSPAMAELADLTSFERQLGRLQERGLLEPALAEDLRARARECRRLVTEPPRVQQAVAGRPAPAGQPAAEALPGLAPGGTAPEPILAELVEAPSAVSATAKQPPVEAPISRPEVPEPAPDAKPPEPVLLEPRMSWAGILASFMEERNIRWGELIGGLLMVSAAVCLVISLRTTLAEHPLLQFCVAGLFLAAFFGAGLYAYHRWKLENTSRALLIVDTLFVPLYFFATATLFKGDWTGLTWLTQLGAWGVFFWLAFLAAKVLVPEGRWFQVAAVLGNSAAVLLAARTLGNDPSAWLFLGIGVVPVAVFAASMGGLLYRLSDQEDLTESRTNGLFTVLGVATFSLAPALGLLVVRGATEAGGMHECLSRFSILLALAATPLLAAGLTAIRGTSRDDSLAAQRTVGTLVALVAVAAMLVALGLAWPQPWAVFAVSGLTCAALGLVAFRYRFPVAHAGAIASATIAFLIGFHLLAGNVTWVEPAGSGPRILQLAIGSSSGLALVGLSLLFGLAGELLVRFGHRAHAVPYAGGCGVAVLLSLLIVSLNGLSYGGNEAARAMGVYSIYAAAALGTNLRWRRPLFSYLGLLLLLGATLWALQWQTAHVEQLWAAALGIEALAMVALGTGLTRLGGPPGPARQAGPTMRAAMRAHGATMVTPAESWVDAYRLPLWHVAELVAALALLLAFWTAKRPEAAMAPIVTVACLVAVWLTLAWGYRSVVRTWIGSTVLLLGLMHTTAFNLIHTAAFQSTGLADRPWVLALLTHATIAVLASLGLSAWGRKGDRHDLCEAPFGPFRQIVPVPFSARRVFIEPLGATAMISSALVIPLLCIAPYDAIWLATYLFWLAAIWLAAAWTNRSAALLSAAQVVLTLAVVMGTTAWLERHPWASGAAVDFSDPRSLQAYGIGLGLLTLAWLVARIGLRGVRLARDLLNPAWPAVDWAVGHVLVVAQLLLAAWETWLGCRCELRLATTLRGATVQPSLDAFGPAAWCLLGLLALAMIVALWRRWRKAELVSSLLVGATVPCLIAGRFGSDLLTASAARWALATGFLAGAGAVWGRKTLATWCSAIGARLRVGRDGPRIARAVLIATTALPVLLLTVLAALLQLSGTSPVAPAADTFFAQIGPNASYLVPLMAVMAGLVGLALREASAGYAFSAGLVAELGVVLGYALSVSTSGRRFEMADLVVELQLATITAAVWAGIWLIARRWVNVWREDGEDRSARPLMDVQLGMGAIGNGLLLVPALLAIALPSLSLHGWTIAEGTWLGWSALVLVAVAAAYREVQLGRQVQPFAAGLLGMAALGLLACTVSALWPAVPEWGYRTLMLGWAMYALFVVLATWWVASLRTLPSDHGPPQPLIRAAAAWVSTAGILAVLLGLKAAVLHRYDEDLLWAAAAIALASIAGAAMAVWRRQEGWAFAAAPGVNLAASLVVWFWHWHYRPSLDFGDWWLLLVQANVIASATVALVWLAARKRLYELRDLTVRHSPLLAVQTALGVIGNGLLLIPAVVALVGSPDAPPGWMANLAAPAGWVALFVAAAAAGGYLRQVSPQALFDVLGGLGLGLGVLGACSVVSPTLSLPAGLNAPWLPYHVLTASWAVLGLALLGVGWLVGRLVGRTLLSDHDVTDKDVRPTDRLTRGAGIAPRPVVLSWVTLIGALAVALGLLWCNADPEKPWWSVGAIVAASLAAGLLAMWMRLPLYVYLSGLLLNAAGTVTWLAWGPQTPARFVEANVLCLAVASAIWSLARPLHPRGVPDFALRSGRVSFAHLAAQAGLALLGVLIAVVVALDVLAVEHSVTDWFRWATLAATAAAVAICVWDRSARFPLPGLYLIGLLAVGAGLDALRLSSREFCWTAGYALAGFVLVAAILGWLLPRLSAAWRAMRIPTDDQRWPAGWLSVAQLLVGAAAAGLGAWISIDFAFDGIAQGAMAWLPARMLGPLACLALLLAAVLMARQSSDRHRCDWQRITLGLGVLLLSEAGWAWLSPALPLPWMHRCVVLMAGALAMMAVAGLGLPRLLSSDSEWIKSGRQMLAALGALAGIMLAAVFVQEVWFYQRPKTPMAVPAVVLVALAFAGSIAACLAFAIFPRRDPLRLSDRGRQAYVYLAEFLLLLVCVHLRLTVPKLFELAMVEKYWMLLVLAVAFCGVGLSELFQRRGLPVLSEPLERTAALLPLLPAIGFWIPTSVTRETLLEYSLVGQTPAVWFLGAVFYGIRAVTRRSGLATVLSVAAVSVGFCVLWHQHNIRFLDRPQLWIIPAALACLIAEYLNHERLNSAQSGMLRYLAMSLIYVSTCADMFFINKFEHSLAVPLLLMLLSVLGALAGIVLRIRSFLVLGLAFLLVSITSMIYYAVVHLGPWVLWTSILGLGLGIIVLFAVFEKRRNDILAAVGRLREWQR